jgi:CelD/BcsL family acetyltransferase involved in cellulose biosynthesis
VRVTVIRADEVDSSVQQRWDQFRLADPLLASPYFCIEYVRAVARVRPDVRVAVVECDGLVRGFFPYQRAAARVAAPVGGRLSDWHGLVSDAALELPARALLRACGLHIWDFDHVPASQRTFERHATRHDASPVMDLGQGFAAYVEQRRAAGAQRVSQMLRKARKLERELGDIRFEADCRDPRALAQVVQWKREQCRRTGVVDFLGWGWTTAMLEQIAAVDTPAFAGRLSVLWHGDTMLAAHFGMRSDLAWHWWFPGYNETFADYSPGGILLLKVAEAAAEAGLRHVDLGKGEDPYKRSFATHALPLMEGSVMVPSLDSGWRLARTRGTDLVRRAPVLAPARSAWRQLRQWWSAREVSRARG